MKLSAERKKDIEVPNDPDGAFIRIRCLSKQETFEIGMSCVSPDGSIQGRYLSDKEKKTVEACLVNWGNFKDSEDKPLDFNPEALALAQHSNIVIDVEVEAKKGKKKETKQHKIRFNQWVLDEHKKFQEEVEKEEALAEGN